MEKMIWDNKENTILLNPSLDDDLQKRVHDLIQKAVDSREINSHVWMMTSGSSNFKTGIGKVLAISKEAFLCSAHSVNQHLQASHKDRWGIAIPQYHVGGLSIEARSFLSGSYYKRFSPKWSAKNYIEFLKEEKVSLTSLVPTQVYDLISHGFKSPPQLRAVVVGGASLSEKLYLKARELGWPLLPSYGMSETASQIATAGLESLNQNQFPNLKVLSHAKIRVVKNIEIKSKSLFSFYIYRGADGIPEFRDPKKQGWFQTEDLGELILSEPLNPESLKYLKVLGRESQFVKIKGEGVHFDLLEKHFNETLVQNFGNLVGKCVIKLFPNERDGFEISLCCIDQSLDQNLLNNLMKSFNESVLKHEQILNIKNLFINKSQISFKNLF